MPTSSALPIAIAGCAGRMGQALVRLSASDPQFALVGGSVPPGSAHAGQDIGTLAGIAPLNIRATDNIDILLANAEAVIDFTTRASTLALAEHTAAKKKIHVIGTTGFSETEKQKLAAFAQRTVIVYSANMSLGANLLAGLVEQAARILGKGYDIDIFDHHHKHKVDAPSGTALMLGEATARAHGEITYNSERSGEAIGDHRVTFTNDSESITLSHHAENRDIFAAGALKAALWARGKKPGLYSVRDVLGI